VDVLSRRSIREKLLCYFRQLADEAGSDTFTLPFSLSTLADYIATDRSAMMRELKRLREEGVIRSDGRKFTLYS
jgi:CRP-like cAMP-binding protein